MNRSHSGPILAAAGFVWLIAALAVLVENALVNLWAAVFVVGLSFLMFGRVRYR
jgi:uncharacterized membrane protein HdeD (DUF308 family)